MDIEQIGQKYTQLTNDLRKALSTMERSDRVITIRTMIKDLQTLCPHNNGSFDFSDTEKCPYCGKKFLHHSTRETDPDWQHGVKMY